MKIALIGYGKMGKEIGQIALQRGHEVVARIHSGNAASFTAKSLAGAEAAIEFTRPEHAVANIFTCFDAHVPVVVGTTGWLQRLDEVKQRCADTGQGLFYASNFSVGVNIFFQVNKFLAKIMDRYPEYEISLEEIHHIHKLDAPSGTGLTLASQVLEHIRRKEKWVNAPSSSANELALVSKREGEVPGTHIVDYDSPVDRIEIRHVAHNRKGFALGAVLAAEFMKGKKGVYGMEDLLKL
jgi:4-hydroxy-tetrahydrodipicolinate reductase